jgi:hypothetical protein
MIRSRRVNVACVGWKVLVDNPEGNIKSGKRNWENNIKMEHREDGAVWAGLIWFRIGTSGGLL